MHLKYVEDISEARCAEPELNELPDSGENEVTEPRDTGDFEAQSPVFSTGNRGSLIQLDCGNYGAPFRWKRSSETFLEHQTACFCGIYSSSSTTRHFSRFVVIFGFQAL